MQTKQSWFAKIYNQEQPHVKPESNVCTMVLFSGEDRWLCTLLLQQGYRVEYSAAADAYTHAPVGFSEFFGQRRRWITSTFANLMDLLKYSYTIVYFLLC